MSNTNEPSDNSKPVIKDKNPHNYRKVGYSMIVISVSLVLIGLLVWAIGDNYHFSTDIMANQEIDSMTPKHGYNLVLYDAEQPIGAKLKLLGSASTMEAAQQKLSQYSKDLNTDKATVLIFNETLVANQKQVVDTIDAIAQVQASIMQKIKDQEAQAAKTQNATVVTPPVTSSTPLAPTNTPSSSNTTKIIQSGITQSTIPINDTVIVQLSNSTLTGKPTGNSENLAIDVNVTTSYSSSAMTSNQNKTLPLSEHVSVSSK